MPTIRVPPGLRSAVGERELVAEGASVGEALKAFTTQFPQVKDQLFEEDRLRKFVNVYLNEQDIQYLQGLDTPSKPDDTIIILPAMAGGTSTTP